MDSEHEPGRIAFITCLPPQDTGVATYSFYSWLGFEGSIDVFCPVTDSDWFFSMKNILSNRGAGPRLLDVDGFMSMDSSIRYEEIVIAAGNSNHHVYIFNVIKKLATFGLLSRVTLYIHDPCLLNLVQVGTELSTSQLRDCMSRIYHRDLAELPDNLLDAGIYGIRYFLNAGIGRYLVNSWAAQKLVEHDLRDTTARIDRIFLPAFLAKRTFIQDAPRLPEDRLVVGVFGLPSQDKGLEKITGAVRFLNESGRPSSLILAGFLTRKFVLGCPHLFRDIDMELVDGPADSQLVHSMQQCHLAVQLRERNLGESSGIVPQLLCLGKDVIVSAVGAFKEFGDAVRIVNPDISVMELANEILNLRDNPIAAGTKQNYVDEHGPDKFQAKFMQLFSKAKRRPDIGTRSGPQRSHSGSDDRLSR